MNDNKEMKLWTGTCAVLATIFTWMIMNSETQTLAQSKPAPSPQVVERSQKATFGGGCFWCTEAMLEDVEGILSVVSGYAGGHVKNPTYRHVCEGTTGHAEVVQVIFDPVKITYKRVLELFWRSHDPTSLNRQGADVGTQYRSTIMWHNEGQKTMAEASMKEAASLFARPIVTKIEKMDIFYPAEDYHQDYFKKNPTAGYCNFVIRPKLKKFKQYLQK
jgi:peptide-methionine (S)-S-oxide reductase